MSPDEARIMRFLVSNPNYPLINIKLVTTANSSFVVTHRHVSLLGLDAQCAHPPLAANYIDNLERLGLLTVSTMTRMFGDEPYKRIEEFPQIDGILADLRKHEGKTVELEKIRLEVTDLGKQFMRVCVIDKTIQERV